LSTLSKSGQTVGQAMNTLGKAMVGIGTAAAAALGASTKAAIDWESAFAGVRKTVDASEAEFAQLEQGLLNMSKTIPIAATELASIAEVAGQLGVAKEDILAFTETMANLGVATNLTAEEAATAFAQLANIMQEPIDNIDNLGAALVDLGNNSATTERDILNFAQRIAGAGKLANLTSQDLLGIGAAFSSVGIEAEAGGTAVQKVLMNMTEAVAQGGEQLDLFAKTAGMSAQEFKKMWETDAAGAFTAFVEGLGNAGDDAIGILDELGLSDQRLVRGFLSVANAGDLMRDSIGRSNSAFQENTALIEEASRRYETTASQIQLLKNNLFLLGNAIGSAVLPVINQMIEKIIPLINAFVTWTEAHPRLAAVILTVVAGLGALVAIIMILAPIITALITVFTAFAAVAGLISLPILLIVAAIVAVIAIIWLLVANWETVWGIIVSVVTTVWQVIQTVITTALQIIMQIIQMHIDMFVMIFQVGWMIIQTVVQTAMMIIQTIITTAWQIITTIVQTAMQIITTVIQTGWNIIKTVVTTVMQAIQTVIQTAWNTIKTITQTTLTAIQTAVQTAMNTIKNIFQTAWNAIKTLVQNALNQLLQIAQSVMEQVKSAISAGVEAIKGIFNGLKGAIDSVIGKFREMASAAREALSAAGRAVSSKLGGISRQHGGTIPGSFSEAVPAILHGGERVIPRTGTDVNAPQSGGGGSTINIIIEGDVNSMDMVSRIADAVKESIGRDNELAQFGVGI
jgi:TP901 family phage tail tape measure protein